MINLLDSDSLTEERLRLVRLCYRLTGNPTVAEDLAHDTLLAACQATATLREPERRAAWLTAIARNLCRQWLRHQHRERSSINHLSLDVLVSRDDGVLAAFDPLLALERHEQASLLARALALLPAETRIALISRFVDQLPHAAIAARLQLSPAASLKRVERGVAALRRLLMTTLGDEPPDPGLRPHGASWRATRIWCPRCGRSYCEAFLVPAKGLLRLRCPSCNHDGDELVTSGPADRLDVVTVKPALNRLFTWIHSYYHQEAHVGTVPCLRCRQRVPLRIGYPPAALQVGTPPRSVGDQYGIYAWCTDCDTAAGVETWWSFTLGLPEVWRFWRDHPRMRALPERAVNACGAELVVTGFESVTGDARIEVTTVASTLAIQHIERS